MKKAFLSVSPIYFFLNVSSLFACSVCIGGYSQEKLDAYFVTTVALSGIPFLFGLSFFFIYRYYKKKAKLHAGEHS